MRVVFVTPTFEVNLADSPIKSPGWPNTWEPEKTLKLVVYCFYPDLLLSPGNMWSVIMDVSCHNPVKADSQEGVGRVTSDRIN